MLALVVKVTNQLAESILRECLRICRKDEAIIHIVNCRVMSTLRADSESCTDCLSTLSPVGCQPQNSSRQPAPLQLHPCIPNDTGGIQNSNRALQRGIL